MVPLNKALTDSHTLSWSEPNLPEGHTYIKFQIGYSPKSRKVGNEIKGGKRPWYSSKEPIRHLPSGNKEKQKKE